MSGGLCSSMDRTNEQTSRNPRRVAHCRVSSLVMVCRRSFAAKSKPACYRGCAHTTLTHIFRVSNRCYDAILSVRQEVL